MKGYLLISGSKERKNGYELGEGKYYECAKLLKLDLQSGAVNTVLQKAEGGQHYPKEHPNLQYSSCCLVDGVLWLPTDTEVYKLSYPELKVLTIISHPFFHNIHSVNVFDDRVYVTSTGLDMVAVFDTEGTLIELFNTEGKEVWHRFSKHQDYRMVHSTRPHDCHPNFVFTWKGKIWVTRCKQQDAVRLDDVNEKIEITNPAKRISVHDGVVFKDKVYFTTVDGYLVVADPQSKEREQEINLLLHMNESQLGWARGLSMTDDAVAYVAFSRIRRTRMIDRLAWLAKGDLEKMKFVPACILAFDLNSQRVLQKYDLPIDVIDAIYGVEFTPV